jgi:hypothetical protein
MRIGVGRFLSLVGTATAGLLAAHELDYRLIVPDPLHRHDLLLRTGHGYLSKALFFALIVGVMSLIGSLAVGIARGRAMTGASRTRSIAGFLALVQAGGFLLLEGVERVIVGAAPDDRFLAVTLAGVAVQIASALVGSLLLRLFERAGETIGRRARIAMPRLSRAFGFRPARALVASRAIVRFSSRAPPLPAG